MYDSTLLVFSLHISKPWMSIAVSYNVQWQIQTQVLTICHVLTFPLFFSWVRGSKQQCWGVVTFKRHIAMVFVVHSDAMRCWFASVGGRFRRLTLDKIVTVFARDLHAWHTLWLMIGHRNVRIFCNNRAWTRFSYTLQYADVVCQRIVSSAKWPVSELVCSETSS